MKKPFNPDDFLERLTVEDVVEKFPQLKTFDYSTESLNEKLIQLNHEVISQEYEDKKFEDIKNYYHIEVDKIV